MNVIRMPKFYVYSEDTDDKELLQYYINACEEKDVTLIFTDTVDIIVIGDYV